MSEDNIHFDRRETVQTPALQGGAEPFNGFGAAALATDDRQDSEDGNDISGIAQDDDEVTEADPDDGDDDEDDDDDDDDDEDALTDLGDETGAHV